MILSLILLIIMICAVVYGWRKGFVEQLCSLVGLIIAFVVSIILADPIATVIRSICNLLTTHPALYNTIFWKALGFLIAFVILYAVLHWVARILNKVASLPVLKQFNSILGAIVGFIIGGLCIAIVMSVLRLLNIDWLNAWFATSTVANFIAIHFPIFFL